MTLVTKTVLVQKTHKNYSHEIWLLSHAIGLHDGLDLLSDLLGQGLVGLALGGDAGEVASGTLDDAGIQVTIVDEFVYIGQYAAQLVIGDGVIPLECILDGDGLPALVVGAVYGLDSDSRVCLTNLSQTTNVVAERANQIVNGGVAPGALAAVHAVLVASERVVVDGHEGDLLHASALGLFDDVLQGVLSDDVRIIDEPSLLEIELLNGGAFAT